MKRGGRKGKEETKNCWSPDNPIQGLWADEWAWIHPEVFLFLPFFFHSLFLFFFLLSRSLFSLPHFLFPFSLLFFFPLSMSHLHFSSFLALFSVSLPLCSSLASLSALHVSFSFHGAQKHLFRQILENAKIAYTFFSSPFFHSPCTFSKLFQRLYKSFLALFSLSWHLCLTSLFIHRSGLMSSQIWRFRFCGCCYFLCFYFFSGAYQNNTYTR